MVVSGTEGYAEEAATLLERYESIAFETVHRQVMHLFPEAPCAVLDIGAGTGRDAAWFAERGDRVVAVEPTEAMRAGAMRLHPSQSIEWVDDSLPDLRVMRARGELFDLISMSAVWMHLDARQRAAGMPNVAALLRDGGLLALSLRHGPVPSGRRMFEVSAQETIDIAAAHGLRAVVNARVTSATKEGVTWDRLALLRDRAAEGR